MACRWKTLYRRQGFSDSRVDGGVIELVLAIIREKKFQPLADQCFIDRLSAQRPLNQDWRAIAHVARDHLIGQLRPPDMAQGSIDGMHQVQAGVNQRAVQVKDHQLDGVRIKSADAYESSAFRIKHTAAPPSAVTQVCVGPVFNPDRTSKARLHLALDIDTIFPVISKYVMRPHKSSCPPPSPAERVAKFADMFSAMGTEPRLRIMQLLLTAHPEGLVVSEIQEELDIPNSTLSHHLDKLRTEGLVEVQREGTFLRYTANTAALQELLQFLYAECCTRNQAVKPQDIIQICK